MNFWSTVIAERHFDIKYCFFLVLKFFSSALLQICGKGCFICKLLIYGKRWFIQMLNMAILTMTKEKRQQWPCYSGPSRSAERVPCEQVFLNKTIEQKIYWTNPDWTNNYWTGDRLNKRSVDQILFENLLTEHLNNWTKMILNILHLSKWSIEHITNWTLNKPTLNKY